MKIKIGSLFLVLGLGLSVAIVVATGCAAGPDTSARKRVPVNPNPTWSGDQHDPPVYTSPAVPDKKICQSRREGLGHVVFRVVSGFAAGARASARFNDLITQNGEAA